MTIYDKTMKKEQFKQERIEELQNWKREMSFIEQRYHFLPVVEICSIKCRDLHCDKCLSIIMERINKWRDG